MPLIWTITATCLLVASSIATFMTMLHLRCRWNVHTSSVRWLFWVFFACVCAWCSLRSAFFVWMSSRPRIEIVEDEADVDVHRYSYGQLDRLGIHGILYLEEAKKVWITAVLCLGDLALFGIAIALFPLAYELARLARKSMDRGAEKERAKIRVYRPIIGCSLVVYGATQLVLTVVFGGYNIHTHRCLLAVYGLQFVALVFMASRLLMLKFNGRKFETIQGTFVASPVYQRLKRIMLVYAVFVFQFQLSMIIIYLHNVTPDDAIIDFVGVSLLVYNASGLALAITTSCSQACVFSACAPCLPEDFEAQFTHQRLTAPSDEDLEAPRANPIFVYTDIQSSTALWNKNSAVMSAATEIHDNILRSALLKHRGYEITTIGDAFQVAFHTMRDAVEYSMDVQLQLLVAKWPKEIHGLVPATSKVSDGRRVLFRGLRVRMGIHDASEVEGRLVKDTHAVTGKTTYSGMSEVVAEYVGDLGAGGQILVTDRVATWLRHHREDLSVDVFMEYVGAYTVPQVNAAVEIYQLQPSMLAARTQFFKTPEKALAVPLPLQQPVGHGEVDRDSFQFPLGAIAEENADEVDREEALVDGSVSEHHPASPVWSYKALSTPRPAPLYGSWIQAPQQLTIAA